MPNYFYIYRLLLLVVLTARTSLAYSQSDTGSINKLIHYTHTILNPDSAIGLYDSALLLSIEADYADGAFLALITKGIKYFEKQDYENYRQASFEALEWAHKSSAPDNAAWAYINIGEAWFSEGDYITANEYYFKGLEDLNSRTTRITHTTANIYNCLGLVNMRLNQFSHALEYFNRAESVSLQGNLPYQLGISYENKAAWYLQMHQADSAEKYAVLEMNVGRTIGKVDLRAFAFAKLGKTYVMKRQYGKAIAALDSSVALAQNRFQPPIVDAAYTLGEALTQMGNYREAENKLQWAFNETRRHNYKDYYPTGYSSLAALYRAMGKPQLALAYLDTLISIKDTLTNADKARAIKHLEIKYQSAEKDKALAQNSLLIEQQRNKLTNKNLLIGSVLIGLCLLSVIFVFIYRNTRHRQKLAEGQVRTLEQEREIIRLVSKIEGEEKERTRIARELHDGLGGMISAIMMRFSTLPRSVPPISNEPAYNDTIKLLSEAGEEIRKIAHNLMPEILQKQLLPDAVTALCTCMQQDGTLQINAQSYGNFSNLSASVKLNVYRIIQELLKNAVQHASASHVLVQLMRHENQLTVTVEDNGRGFQPGSSFTGMGLDSIQTRVKELGGHFSIESTPTEGTTTYIEIELSATRPI